MGTLFEKLALVGRDLLLETLPAYLAGESLSPNRRIPKQDHLLSKYQARRRNVWIGHKTNRELFNQVRGMYPWPVAHTLSKG